LIVIFGRAKKNAKPGGKSEFYKYPSNNTFMKVLQTTPF